MHAQIYVSWIQHTLMTTGDNHTDKTEIGYDTRLNGRNVDQTDVPNCPHGVSRLMLLLPTKFCAMPANMK